jgi:enoyl-CoA hydratase/carnithine racemase
MSGNGAVDYRVEGRIATISLNRPDKRNAYTADMLQQLVEHVRAADGDDAVHVIVLRGEGDDFCAGADRGMMADPEAMAYGPLRGRQQLRRSLAYLSTPMIAGVQGHALGGGLQIALRADIRIASADAVMAMPEIRHGLVPDAGGTYLLTALVGPEWAHRLILTGESIPAEQSLRLGLVSQVVPTSELTAAVAELADSIARAPRQALALAKRLLADDHDRAWERAMGAELLAQTALAAQRKDRR